MRWRLHVAIKPIALSKTDSRVGEKLHPTVESLHYAAILSGY
jgi:hypothetical protein